MPNLLTTPTGLAAPFRSERAEISLICEVRQGTRIWRAIKLDNLSREGFRLCWQPDINMEQPLRIRIPGLHVLTAQIRWRTSVAVGCEFLEPLHCAVFEHLVRQAQV